MEIDTISTPSHASLPLCGLFHVPPVTVCVFLRFPLTVQQRTVDIKCQHVRVAVCLYAWPRDELPTCLGWTLDPALRGQSGGKRTLIMSPHTQINASPTLCFGWVAECTSVFSFCMFMTPSSSLDLFACKSDLSKDTLHLPSFVFPFVVSNTPVT